MAEAHRDNRLQQQQRSAGPAGHTRGRARDRGQVHQVRVQPRRDDGGHLQEGGEQHQHQQAPLPVPVQRLVSADQQGGLQVTAVLLSVSI